MMRAFFLGGATVALVAVGMALGFGLRLGPESHAANKADVRPPKMGFVSCSDLTLKSTEWQRGTKAINEKRAAFGQKLAASGANVNQLKMRLDAVADPSEKGRLNVAFIDAARQHDDDQRKCTAELDEEALKVLQELHASFEKALKAEVKERSLDVVFGCPIHPDQLFKNGQKPMIELNHYFRPSAANPIHLAPELDITDAVAARMNAGG